MPPMGVGRKCGPYDHADEAEEQANELGL
ncbi:MAG: hypothetical protein RJA77_694, partial [Pseudomonadota bacterium]